MRIVGGAAGGRRLAAPPGGTRPTADRVREALFSLLEARDAVRGARVLDLFAGSGALGIEALSRGASSAVLVERDPRACRAIHRNLATAAVTGGAVRRAGVATFLQSVPWPADLIFVDPPYADAVDDVLGALTAGWVAPGALLVVERDARAPAPGWPPGLEPAEPRRYGETTLHLATG